MASKKVVGSKHSGVTVPEHLQEIFQPADWMRLEPYERQGYAAGVWQDAANFTKNATTASAIVDYFPWKDDYLGKPSDLNWRDLQKGGFDKYKTFGPLNAAIDSKANFVAEKGFSVYSDVYEINEFLEDLFNSMRNRLYFRLPGWIVRMLTEVEIYVLIVLDDTGTATLRLLEPQRIGENPTDVDDTGLILDPDDCSQTLFYVHNYGAGVEWIPDARFIIDEEFMIERQKALADKFKSEKILPITKGKGKLFGGYRRFVLHWKNLTGILEIQRDTSGITTILEWINLYIQSLKIEQDYKKALCSYAYEIIFADTPAGKVAWHLWKKMTDEEKAATNLTSPFSPGSRVFSMPGMTLKVHSVPLQALHGNNKELLNLAGAGARTPEDLWQGESAGSTFASLKTSRPPLVAEIENLQNKFEKFLRFELLRCCLAAKIKMGGSFLGDGGQKLKLQETYDVLDVDYKVKTTKGGGPAEPKIVKRKHAPHRIIHFTWPTIRLDADAKGSATAYMGTKHAGLYGQGAISSEDIAQRMGVDDFTRQQKKRYIEETLYGPPTTGAEVEKAVEEKPTDPTGKKELPEPEEEKTTPQEGDVK